MHASKGEEDRIKQNERRRDGAGEGLDFKK